ncbi:MAG: hypothetical protein GQ557_02570 [Mycoplasmataceae bacterium]|nr:hypothetical protein [Mycoplasmataceae bacterium]
MDRETFDNRVKHIIGSNDLHDIYSAHKAIQEDKIINKRIIELKNEIIYGNCLNNDDMKINYMLIKKIIRNYKKLSYVSINNYEKFIKFQEIIHNLCYQYCHKLYNNSSDNFNRKILQIEFKMDDLEMEIRIEKMAFDPIKFGY